MKRSKYKGPVGVKPIIIDSMTAAQQLMVEDGAPASILAITQAERNQSWIDNSPKAMPMFMENARAEDASTTAFRRELEARAEAQAASKRERTSRAEERSTSAPRPSREGLVTVAAIAAELGVLPRIARAALRAAKIAKPAQGWAFTPGSDLEKQVRATIAAAKNAPVKSRGTAKAPRKSSTPKIPADAVWSGSSKEKAKWRKQQQSSSSSKPTVSAPSRSSSTVSATPSQRSKASGSASPRKSMKSSKQSRKSSAKRRGSARRK